MSVRGLLVSDPFICRSTKMAGRDEGCPSFDLPYSLIEPLLHTLEQNIRKPIKKEFFSCFRGSNKCLATDGAKFQPQSLGHGILV